MIQILKCLPEYYQAILDGAKTFEVRKNDRDFSVGDTLKLQEFDPSIHPDGTYTGRHLEVEVTYLLPGGKFGIPEDYCVMAIRTIDHKAIRLRALIKDWNSAIAELQGFASPNVNRERIETMWKCIHQLEHALDAMEGYAPDSIKRKPLAPAFVVELAETAWTQNAPGLLQSILRLTVTRGTSTNDDQQWTFTVFEKDNGHHITCTTISGPFHFADEVKNQVLEAIRHCQRVVL